jgi:N-methylhydantoinase B
MNNVLIGNDRFAYYETVGGGQGGRPNGGGQSGIQTGMTNTRNTPIESLSTHYPFRITRYTLRRGSGGDGLHPGGDGIDREIEFHEDATVSLMGERRRHRPWGLQGGDRGDGGGHLIRADGGDRGPAREGHDRRRAGGPAAGATPGGGGWGARMADPSRDSLSADRDALGPHAPNQHGTRRRPRSGGRE